MENHKADVEGGCFCGSIRYKITGTINRVGNCHCTMCRRTSGAPFVSWLMVPKNQFSYLSGGPKHLQSSKNGERWFCENCGTPIACIVHHEGKEDRYIDITLGSLDNPNDFRPTREWFEDTKLAWLK
jgi:hypothetical protein